MKIGALFSATCVAICLASPADAQWISKVSGPDVFGTTTVTSVGVATGFGLNISCNDHNKLSFNVLLSLGGLSPHDVQSIPIKVLVKVDGDKTLSFNGNSRPWNQKYLAIEVDGPKPAIIKLIHEIAKAKRTINVGIENHGSRYPFKVGVYNSTKSMKRVIKFCKIK